MRRPRLHAFAAAPLAVLVAAAVAAPVLAQTKYDEGATGGGTGGAAGYSPVRPDADMMGARSRSMAAPDMAPSAEAPEPMNAPPVADDKKEESPPPAADAPKDK